MCWTEEEIAKDDAKDEGVSRVTVTELIQEMLKMETLPKATKVHSTFGEVVEGGEDRP